MVGGSSSTTKTGPHDIAESGVKHQKSNQITVVEEEPPTMGSQLVNFITCGCESSAPFL
jgi:hypothetical protein